MSKTHTHKSNNNSRRKSLLKQKRSKQKSLSPYGLICEIKKSISKVPDTRQHSKNFRYELADVAIAIIIGLVRKCADFNSVHIFITKNIKFLHRYGIFTNPESKGKCPSKATLYRLVEEIDSELFQKAFIDFVLNLNVKTSIGKLIVVAVDGKRMNGTKCGELERPLNILTAFNSDSKLPVFCEACDVKSNEIKAWDKLLNGLKGKLQDIVFTADAMGCQTKIVEKIKDMNCHYCLAVKGNQGNLEKDSEILVRYSKPVDCYTEKEQVGHGRIEWRECFVFNAVDKNGNSDILDIDKWKNLKTIIMVRAHRTEKKTGNESTVEERLYISDLDVSAEEFNSIIRSHWSVEIFHLCLDSNFNQDNTKRSNDTNSAASKNLDTLQKFAYVILTLFEISNKTRYKTYKPKGIKTLMIEANSNNNTLSKILNTKISIAC